MTTTPNIQTMKETTLETSLEKRVGRPPKTETIEAQDHKARMDLAQRLILLDSQIEFAKAGGFDWLEVDESILKKFSKGEMPKAGYVIYKDIKLCLPGQAQSLAERDNLSVHAIVFAEEAKTMKVGVTRD